MTAKKKAVRLCDRLAKKTVAVLRKMAECYRLRLPDKITKKKLVWAVAGAVLRDPPKKPKGKPKKLWYLVRTAPGQEKKVRRHVLREAKVKWLNKLVGKVIVPRVKEVRLVKGARKVIRAKAYPGYLFCNVALTDDTFHIFDSAPGCFGFLPERTLPQPLDPEQMEAVMAHDHDARRKDELPVKTGLSAGDKVVVTEGAFEDYKAVVKKVTGENTPDPRVTVVVEVLGRPVDLELKTYQYTLAKN